MKRKTVYIVMIITTLYLICLFFGIVHGDKTTTAPLNPVENQTDSKDIKKIKIKFDVADYIANENTIKVNALFINTSAKQFSGDLSITLIDEANEIVFKDTLHVKSLAAGKTSTVGFWMEKCEAKTEELEWSNVVWKEF